MLQVLNYEPMFFCSVGLASPIPGVKNAGPEVTEPVSSNRAGLSYSVLPKVSDSSNAAHWALGDSRNCH